MSTPNLSQEFLQSALNQGLSLFGRFVTAYERRVELQVSGHSLSVPSPIATDRHEKEDSQQMNSESNDPASLMVVTKKDRDLFACSELNRITESKRDDEIDVPEILLEIAQMLGVSRNTLDRLPAFALKIKQIREAKREENCSVPKRGFRRNDGSIESF